MGKREKGRGQATYRKDIACSTVLKKEQEKDVGWQVADDATRTLAAAKLVGQDTEKAAVAGPVLTERGNICHLLAKTSASGCMPTSQRWLRNLNQKLPKEKNCLKR